MTEPHLEARASRTDLTPAGVPGRVELRAGIVVFEGEGLRFDLPSASLSARIGGLDERFLFLQSSELPGLEIAIDRQRAAVPESLLLLDPVARALGAGRRRRHRFWGCLLALGAVLTLFALMILILFSLIARAALGAPSPEIPEVRVTTQGGRAHPGRPASGRYRIAGESAPESAAERRASRP